MSLSVWQIVLVVVLFLLLFGRGKIPALMSDLASGIKSFKAGMKEDITETGEADKPELGDHRSTPATVVKDAEKA